MTALHAASAARTTHEVDEHGYTHVRLADEPSYMPFQRSRPKETTS